MKTIIISIITTLILVPGFADEFESREGMSTISGYIKDEKGEDLIGANIFLRNKNQGTTTNVYGFYSLTLPNGEYELVYSFIGYEPEVSVIKLDKNLERNIALNPKTEEIEEVSVSSVKKDVNIRQVNMSSVKLAAKTIKKIPVLMGETDVIKSLQLLPGVQSSVEGSSGYYVRGGNADQNLILLDGATVYNPSHLFGFFSVFNGDAIKNVELYKGGIPSEFGGRLSSVLDIRMREGNTQKLSAEGGIGSISSRFTIDGPIVKDRSSFIISGRRTYADLLLPFAKDTIAQNSSVYFYDLNTKFNYILNNNNRLFISGYFGRDVNKFGNMFEMNYGNATGTVRWNHIYNGRLFSNLTFIVSNFDYNLGVPQGSSGFKWISDIIDYSISNDYTYYLNPQNTLKFGFVTTYHTLKPGVSKSTDSESFIRDIKYPNSYALESAFFISNTQEVNSRLSIDYGLRYSVFQNIGEGTIFNFDEQYELVDSTMYQKGRVFNTYNGFEPRLGIRYILDQHSSIKASYNRTVQYMHLASNSTTTFPLDMWFMSNPNVKPQKADQLAVGYFRNFSQNKYETSVEVYYKQMHNTIDFKDHAYLVPNRLLDGELRIGEAESYGIEFMAKKNTGKLTGWISYTYSKTLRDIPEINSGKRYPPPYDKPHNLSIVSTYELNDRISLAANWVFSSAMPVTVPEGGYYYGNTYLPDISKRNGVRIKSTAYHRMDVSFTYHFKIAKKYESNLNLSLYNAYNKHNAFAIYFREKQPEANELKQNEEKELEVVKLYLFPIVPSITFNFKF